MRRSLIAFAGTALAAAAIPALSAADPLSVFQPTAVRPVSVSPEDARALRSLPPLDAFGVIRGTRSPAVEEVGSAAEASRATGLALRLPSAVPPRLAQNARYDVTSPVRTSFTFERTRAAQWASAHRVALAPVPAQLDGATYTVSLAPVAVVTYGEPPRGRRQTTGVRTGEFLAVAQAPLPTIASSGPPLATLVDWFSAQPGMPPHLAAQVRALGDPARTLPIPIRFDKQSASPVQVDGVQGLAIGDETGIGSAVVWTKDGRFYAVGGTLAKSALLSLANGLK